MIKRMLTKSRLLLLLSCALLVAAVIYLWLFHGLPEVWGLVLEHATAGGTRTFAIATVDCLPVSAGGWHAPASGPTR